MHRPSFYPREFEWWVPSICCNVTRSGSIVPSGHHTTSKRQAKEKAHQPFLANKLLIHQLPSSSHLRTISRIFNFNSFISPWTLLSDKLFPGTSSSDESLDGNWMCFSVGRSVWLVGFLVVQRSHLSIFFFFLRSPPWLLSWPSMMFMTFRMFPTMTLHSTYTVLPPVVSNRPRPLRRFPRPFWLLERTNLSPRFGCPILPRTPLWLPSPRPWVSAVDAASTFWLATRMSKSTLPTVTVLFVLGGESKKEILNRNGETRCGAPVCFWKREVGSTRGRNQWVTVCACTNPSSGSTDYWLSFLLLQ